MLFFILSAFSNISALDSKFISILPILDDLELSTCIYPTSNQESKKININLFDLNTNKNLKKNFILDPRSGKGNFFEIKSGVNYPKFKNVGLTAFADELPSRIHVNLMYKCKKHSEYAFTDIALDFVPPLLKDKKNYWFDGLFVNEYKNAIFISNFKSSVIENEKKLYSKTRLRFKFFLHLNNCEKWKMKEIDLTGKNKSNVLFIEDLSYDLFKSSTIKDAKHFSWRIEMIEGSLQDIYCISFNKKKGYIYGDHSF